jgi:RNA polymerase sigma-70 factor (ECF subfamily)
MQDEDLIQKFQEGNEQAFDELVKRYQSMVINTCYRYLDDINDARDVAQNIFIKVYTAGKKFKPEAKFSTWLYRIVINHCLNALRSRKRRRWLKNFSSQKEDQNPAFMQIADEDNNPVKNLEKAERIQAVQRAIDSLSTEQRTAIILHRYQGLSYKEIAEITNISVAAVESRLHRAKLALSHLLADYVSEE